jgi:hypothetical protein
MLVAATTTIDTHTKAIPFPTCAECAKSFAPGQIANNPEISVKDVAPGQESHLFPSCYGCASDFAPGTEKQTGG